MPMSASVSPARTPFSRVRWKNLVLFLAKAMLRRLFAAILIACFAGSTLVLADEGMWTFDNPPLKQWKERYNFEPTKEWLDNLRLASVRLSDGGSSSFV